MDTICLNLLLTVLFFLDILVVLSYNYCLYKKLTKRAGRGSVWLERLLWEQEVDGSSPSAPI